MTAEQGEAVLAIDLGGTKVEAAVVWADGSIADGTRHRAPTGADRTREQIGDSIAEVIARALAASPAPVVGVGIGSAGPVSLAHGTIAPVNMVALHGFDLMGFVRAQVDLGRPDALPIVLRLDGTCIALAEHWLGANAGIDDCMAMVVSTGVGGGIVSGGRLVAGNSGNAGHIGQLQVARFSGVHGDPSHTLEALASGPRSVAWAQGQGWGGTTGEDLARDYAAGNEVAVAAVHRSAAAVGEAIASASTLLDLKQVAIGGGFSRVSADYVELVAAAARSAAFLGYAADVRVVRAALGDDSPLIGAAALVFRADVVASAPAP
ncbi:ROK family protein [Subtercola endophyticus]|uniref:ROK family protein n=1 Tax=Subtercola endophyticus TaxID=2895559 RepID=UPI001E3868F8|nr:ROK family protein [Subtercola endophyticus]UFS58688.1 ROK family protein [Subtercola endophyticus]